MKFFSDFFKGAGNCFKGFGVLFERGLWPYMFVPLALWLLMWIGSIYGIVLLADGISDWLNGFFHFDSIPEEGHWLSWARPFLVSKLSFLISWILKLVFWFMSGTFVKYLLLMLLSPFFAYVSEKTDEKLTGNNFPFSVKQLLKDIFRGVAISLRNMILEYFLIFVCFIITLMFPPLVFITAPFLLLAGWYFIGFSLMDYNCERYKFGVNKSIQFMKKNRGYACGVGFVYSLFLALPTFPGHVLGMMFGPAISVIGATTSFLEIQKASQAQEKS